MPPGRDRKPTPAGAQDAPAEPWRRLAAEAAARRAAEERRREVEALNERLRQQTIELEAQSREAQNLAEELEEQATELEAANLELAESLREAERAREAAHKMEARYRLLFDANPMPVWVYDRDTLRFLTVNASAVREYGYSEEEFLGMTLADIRPAEDVDAMREAVATSPYGLQRRGGWRHRRKDGSLMDVEVVSHGIELDGYHNAELIIVVDVTERRRAEAELSRLENRLRQTEKMEAVGQLAGGVAHDFNNLLTVITTYSGLLLGELPEESSLHADVQQIDGAAKRAASLTRQLLAFSRQQVLRPQLLTLNGVVTGLEKLLRRLVREDIEIVTALDPGAGLVEADPGQLEQVVINLAVNGRDAMPSGGSLTIRTSRAELDSSYAERHAEAAILPGRYVMLSVADTGTGMTEEVRARIFEPFFTTKAADVGTGLGLATVYGIVKQSGGYIWTYSEPGLGTVFKVYLPQVDVVEEAGASGKRKSTPRVTGGETILVAEDDSALRYVTCRALRTFGYRVLEARNGREALELCERHEGPIHAVVTDLVMPEMSGSELADRIAARHAGVKVLLMSGYAGDQAARMRIARAGSAFIEKPFTADLLAARVREVLDG